MEVNHVRADRAVQTIAPRTLGNSVLVFGLTISVVAGCGTRTEQTTGTTSTGKDKSNESRLTESLLKNPAVNAQESHAKAIFPGSNFVGSQACIECHREQYESYITTDHSRSLRKPDMAEEIVDAQYLHDPSGREYRIEKRDGRIFHNEWQHFGNTEPPMPLAEKAIDLVMGSGAFAKSYLVQEPDGLIQAPLTYYVGKQGYEMSPGYDHSAHLGFTRLISDQCLYCHAGILERKGGSQSRFTIHELSIGCERCHGAGKNHVEIHHAKQERSASETDQEASLKLVDTIVNPAKLDRDRVQSLCAQCHLQGNISIYDTGNDAWSFHPGDDLATVKSEYQVGESDGDNAFVGHFWQLDQSLCFQRSETMTCVTCHDPHHDNDKTDLINLRRQQCVSCHSDNDACGIGHSERIETNQNQCVKCHMPTGNSEVPHIATTNHRIAVYPQNSQDEAKSRHLASRSSGTAETTSQLHDQLPVPLALLELAAEGSPRRRVHESLALAIWVIREATPGSVSLEQVDLVLEHLREAVAAAPEVPVDAYAAMGELLMTKLRMADASQPKEERLRIWHEATQYAVKVEQLVTDPVPSRAVAASILAAAACEFDQIELGIARYERLVQMQRSAIDWYNLGVSYARVRRFNEAEAALTQAIRIDPSYPKPYRSLSRLYENIDPARSENLLQRNDRLESIR